MPERPSSNNRSASVSRVTVNAQATEARLPSSIELERRAFRRRQNTRSVVIGAASTIVFAAVVWISLVLSPGWAKVQDSFFDWDTAVAAWPRVFQGFLLNL